VQDDSCTSLLFQVASTFLSRHTYG